MVECIESLDPKLKFYLLSDTKVLGQPHVPVGDSGLAQNVPATAAELASQRLGKAGGVEIMIKVGRPTVRVAGLVATLREGDQQSELIICQNRERETLLERCDPRVLPATNQCVGCAIHAAGKLLAVSERQLVDETGYKTLSYIEVRAPVVQPGIVFVHVTGKSIGCAYTGRCRLVIQTLRPGVYSDEGQIRCSPFQLNIARIVV